MKKKDQMVAGATPPPTQQQQVQVPEQPKKKWAWPKIKVPYLLLTIPTLSAIAVGASVWLVLNPGIITDNLNKPYALLAGPVAAASFLACWLVFKFFRAIEAWVKRTWEEARRQKEERTDLFFWIVILLFMVVSVLSGGSFYDRIEGNIVPGLGHATALFIDLVAVNCMRARLSALRIRDVRGARLYLLGVLVCTGVSVFANLYTSLLTYTPPDHLQSLPDWMSAMAPWFGLVFPALILILSVTADYTVDQTNSKLDAVALRVQEEKRLEALRVRRDTQRDQMQIEKELDDIMAQRRTVRDRKKEREFFLWKWLFPLRKKSDQVDMGKLVEQIMAEVQKIVEPKLTALAEQNTILQQQIATYLQEQRNMGSYFIGEIRDIDRQRNADNSLLFDKIAAVSTGLYEQVSGEISTKIDELISTRIAPFIQGDKQEAYAGPYTDPYMHTYTPNMGDDMTASNASDIPQDTAPQKEPTTGDLPDEKRPAKNPAHTNDLSQFTHLLQTYPMIGPWLSGSIRTVTKEQIIKLTGHSAKMVHNRIKNGPIKRANRDGLYKVESVLVWLSKEPAPRRNADADIPADIPADIQADIQADIPQDETIIETPIEEDTQEDSTTDPGIYKSAIEIDIPEILQGTVAEELVEISI